MSNLIFNALYIFFIVLEMILFLYIIISWFPMNKHIKNVFITLLAPILDPVRYLLKHSIFNTTTADLAPIIGLVIISYLQQFFYVLK